MKGIVYAIMGAILLFVGVICFSTRNAYVKANDDIWKWTSVQVDLSSEAKIDRSRPYDLTYTDDGIDVIFHFIIEE